MPTPNWKPAKGSGRLDRRARQAEEDQAIAEAYEVVNARDGNCCRVTGRFLQGGAVDARVRREHHHLVPRSLAPERVADPDNIILVAAEVHELITGRFIEVEGKDATKAIRFHWSPLMDGRSRPFAIKSRRWSQEAHAW